MLGPVQVLVIGIDDADSGQEALAAIVALADDGPVRCLDVFECTITGDGQLTISGRGSAPTPPSLPLFAEFVDDYAPISSVEDMWHLGEVVPPGSRAVVALLEHRWALGLRDSLRSAGAMLRYETWLDDEDRALLEGLLREPPAGTTSPLGDKD